MEIEWDKVGLGKSTDTAVAYRLGIGHQRVGKERKKRGIPVYKFQQAKKKMPNHQITVDDTSMNGALKKLKVLVALSTKKISPDRANQTLGEYPLNSPAYETLCKVFLGESDLMQRLASLTN